MYNGRRALESVEFLVGQGADVNVKDKEGNPLLYLALYNEEFDFADLLISEGADVNAKDKEGNPLLHCVIKLDLEGYVEELIGRGADVNARNSNGRTLLDLMLDSILEAFELSSHDDISRYPVYIKMLLEAKADVNIKGENEETPLCRVIRSGQVELITLFLESATELKNIPDRYSRTPLFYAIKLGNSDIVHLLLERGIDLHARYEDNTILLAQSV